MMPVQPLPMNRQTLLNFVKNREAKFCTSKLMGFIIKSPLPKKIIHILYRDLHKMLSERTEDKLKEENLKKKKEWKMYENWEDLENGIQNCQKCKLCQKRQHIVLGEGNREAKLMFIGEGPGADEDAQGLPFVGKAGKLMNKAFRG